MVVDFMSFETKKRIYVNTLSTNSRASEQHDKRIIIILNVGGGFVRAIRVGANSRG